VNFRVFETEFHELELLDDITKLRYEGKLPDRIPGKFRNPTDQSISEMEGYRVCASIHSPCFAMVCQRTTSLSPCGN